MDNDLRCISHEIRNQISVCELYTQIIKKTLEKENYKNKSIDNAINCISKSLKLIGNNLIDLKSIDNTVLKRCEIKEIIKEGINLSIVYIQDKDIKINLNCKNGCDVYVDENKFLGCVINIIKNAIEAIDKKGEINIDISEDNNTVNITISNDGKPIDKNADIFEKGYTTKKTGNGFGLAICRENIGLMNGNLKLIKSDSNSTEFLITIPKYN